MLFDKIKKIWYEDKILEIFYIILFWILICHGFIFINQLLSHDSLMALKATYGEMKWKVELGRIFVPAYMKIFRGVLASSWLIGILSLFNLTLVLFFIKNIFKIRRKMIEFLVGGILVCNLTVISQAATYINELDCNMVALLMSVLSCYLWDKENKKSTLAILCLMVSIGIYQSYIAVAVTLMVMKLMLEILDGRSLIEILKKGIKGIIILICGGLLYAIVMKLIQGYYNVAIYSGGYNSVDKFMTMSFYDYLLQSYYAYASCIFILIDSLKFYSVEISRVVHIILFIYPVFLLYYLLKTKRIRIKEKIVFLFLGGILPLAMNITQVLAKGWSHFLMYYAIWLTYFFILVLIEKSHVDENRYTKYYKLLSLGSIFIILWSNIVTANDIYVKKYYEKDATIATMTRIINDLEKVEEYIPGETKVAFIGNIDYLFQNPTDYRRYKQITGIEYNNIAGIGYYDAVIDYILHYDINWATKTEQDFLKNSIELQNMSYYPQKNSIKKINDTIVVKFEIK